MPKLDKKTQKKVGKAEAAVPRNTAFTPIKPGKYAARLTGVSEDETPWGDTQWTAEFSEIHSLKGEKQPGRQWYRLSMPQDPDEVPESWTPRKRNGEKRSKKEMWKDQQEYRESALKAFFDAAGYTPDSDTDEMVEDGAVMLITIRVETAQSGSKKGERVNRVTGVEPLPEGVDFDSLLAGSDDDSGDDTW